MPLSIKIRPGDEITIGGTDGTPIKVGVTRVGSAGKLWLAIDAPRDVPIRVNKAAAVENQASTP